MSDVVCAYGDNITLVELGVRWPLTCQALVDMGLDNGLGQFDSGYEFAGVHPSILAACERALGHMTDAERQIMVCGEHTDQQNVIVKYGLDAYVLQTFLYLAFDGPYSGVYKRG